MNLISQLINGLQCGQYLRLDRTWLHHGLRHREDAELRPRRRYHGWCLHRLCRHQQPGMAPIVAVVFGIFVCAVLGVTIEKWHKPLRKASPLAVLITAIGVNYLLQSLSLFDFSAPSRFL